jgi:hypothetical protein
MATQAQMAANRNNAEKSTGPVTEAGKNRSRHNALRHGLTAQVSALTEEDRAAYDEFSAALIDSLQPEGEVELQLAQSVSDAAWRLNRTRAIETNLFALAQEEDPRDADIEQPELHAALAQARAFRDNAKSFNLLSLYEQRLNRLLHRDLDCLRKLQAERRAQYEAARCVDLEQALLVKEFNESQGLAFSPATDAEPQFGFVFSSREIDLELFRRGQLSPRNRPHVAPNRALGAAA